MATFGWNDGTGQSITTTENTTTGQLTVTTPNNPNQVARSRTLTVRRVGGGLETSLVVRQAARVVPVVYDKYEISWSVSNVPTQPPSGSFYINTAGTTETDSDWIGESASHTIQEIMDSTYSRHIQVPQGTAPQVQLVWTGDSSVFDRWGFSPSEGSVISGGSTNPSNYTVELGWDAGGQGQASTIFRTQS